MPRNAGAEPLERSPRRHRARFQPVAASLFREHLNSEAAQSPVPAPLRTEVAQLCGCREKAGPQASLGRLPAPYDGQMRYLT